MNQTLKKETYIGVVGLGLMGCSIVVSLLVEGKRVYAIAPVAGEKDNAALRIHEQLLLCSESSLLEKPVDHLLANLSVSEDYNELIDCRIVLECVAEDIEIKRTVYQKIVSVVASSAVIASNTSAIPISVLQRLVEFPERFLGIHWAEPAYATKFMEITCGRLTSPVIADWMYKEACGWKKEPTLLRKDIRGFIANRLMYAVYREALGLVRDGTATLEDVDKSFRYDAGSWMTLMGIFRRLDFMGLKDYAQIFEMIFPILNNDDRLPEIMEIIVDEKAKGIHNCHGLYKYTKDEARKWTEAFALFNKDIYRLGRSQLISDTNAIKFSINERNSV